MYILWIFLGEFHRKIHFIFIGYQKSSIIHLAQPVALAAIHLAVKGLIVLGAQKFH
jgi:hypothetical protein